MGSKQNCPRAAGTARGSKRVYKVSTWVWRHDGTTDNKRTSRRRTVVEWRWRRSSEKVRVDIEVDAPQSEVCRLCLPLLRLRLAIYAMVLGELEPDRLSVDLSICDAVGPGRLVVVTVTAPTPPDWVRS
jgi:hypothetical protein